MPNSVEYVWNQLKSAATYFFWKDILSSIVKDWSLYYLRDHGFWNQKTQNRSQLYILWVAYLLELLLSLPTVCSLSGFQNGESPYSDTIKK